MTARLVSISILCLALPKGASDANDPLMLSEKSGPFLVLACRLDGPDALAPAQSVAREFRDEHHLPAYVGGYKTQGRVRWFVFVGDAKTLSDAKAILARVRAIKSRSFPVAANDAGPKTLFRSLLGLPNKNEWKPTVTTNPLLDQSLFFCTRGSERRGLSPRPPAPVSWLLRP